MFGVQKIGNVGEASSLGPNGMIGYTARAGAFLYIGEGEITDKNFTFGTPMERPALFDAGANGGIDFTGDVVHASDSDIVTLRLGGVNGACGVALCGRRCVSRFRVRLRDGLACVGGRIRGCVCGGRLLDPLLPGARRIQWRLMCGRWTAKTLCMRLGCRPVVLSSNFGFHFRMMVRR